MRTAVVMAILLAAATAAAGILPRGVENTQAPGEHPAPPAEALAQITVPEGFRVTLFAGEPDVAQPIAFAFDDRGRLWVVECFSYPDWETKEGRDRVVIFEDTDNDGRFDRRTVFLDDGVNLTGIELGFGGVWLCSAPNLLFVPDRDGDDRPDGPPVVKLDGWNYERVKHNVFNGLIWGPDGWLYGCHGILAESRVGRPGTPDGQRVPINCGIWRYHPVTEKFEVVAHGTTNPWGLDFDDYGEGFFANCVIDHMWHLVPGARYQRMFGQDYDPYSYALMPPCSDHLHWQGDDWNTIGSDGELQAKYGGGHAHCGTMVYLGDGFPDEYRNSVFTHNIHGRRVNRDRLESHGSGYVARHAPDFLFTTDPWFRGVAIGYGPDGGVYLTDWNDLGECHDHDGVYRASGRIYKVMYGSPRAARPLDMARLSDVQLAEMQLHRNDWFVRHARRVLQERAAEGRDIGAGVARLRAMLQEQEDVTRKLRAMWALHAAGELTAGDLAAMRGSSHEHVRAWAVRLTDTEDVAVRDELVAMARREASPRVRLALASGLQRIPAEHRAELAAALATRGEDADDPNLPLLLWYGTEAAVAARPGLGAVLLESPLSAIRTHAARRIVEGWPAQGLAAVAQVLREQDDPALLLDVMDGALQALSGRQGQAPAGWKATDAHLARHPQPRVRRQARRLSLALGQEQAAAELRRIAGDAESDIEERAEAISSLAGQRDLALPPILRGLMTDEALGGAALRALGVFDDPATPRAILSAYRSIPPEFRELAVATLATRPAYASALLDAITRGDVPRTDVSAFAARQIHELGDEALRQRLAQVWGLVQTSSRDKQRLMEKYRRQLTPSVLSTADESRGRAVFNKACSSCHRMFGEGGDIGPDLTGSDRANLDYVLINLIDPSATVARDYQFTTLTTRDGRAVAGLIRRQTPDAVTLRTITEEVVIPRDRIAAMNTLPVSLMPEGLIQTLTDEEVRDLIAYLASPVQVE